jgi:hypothetical protein
VWSICTAHITHDEAGMTIAEATHLDAIGGQCHAVDIKNVED